MRRHSRLVGTFSSTIVVCNEDLTLPVNDFANHFSFRAMPLRLILSSTCQHRKRCLPSINHGRYVYRIVYPVLENISRTAKNSTWQCGASLPKDPGVSTHTPPQSRAQVTSLMAVGLCRPTYPLRRSTPAQWRALKRKASRTSVIPMASRADFLEPEPLIHRC